MRRMHLIELHEEPWCPAPLRSGLRGLLQQIASRLPGYEAVADVLLDALQRSGTTEVLDLCAGAGGPWVRLYPLLRDDPRVTRIRLTDLFPDVPAMEAMHQETDALVEPHPDPVDATRVPADLPGFRTVFAAFHHFDPAAARALLADAVAAGRGIGIFELTERRLGSLALVGLASPPLAIALLPLVRPFRWAHLPLTYIVPAIPWILAFDGVVSCLRSYHAEELLAMAREVEPSWTWTAGRARAPGGPMHIVYLVGTPP